MNFIRDEKLNGLKLFMRDDGEKIKTYYIYEEDFEDFISKNNFRNIVGMISIRKTKKIVDFSINHTEDNKKNAYQASILDYIYNKILPTFTDKNNWNVTINFSHEQCVKLKNNLCNNGFILE